MTIASTGGGATVAMHVFRNGDILLESNDKISGGRKALVLGPPPSLVLYKGVSDKELQEGHPFIFFDYAFAVPLLALESAFAGGPSSVPALEVEKRVVLDPKIEATLAASTISMDKIHFKIASPANVLDGFVDFAKRAAFPDSLELSEWKDRELRTFPTVGKARAAREPNARNRDEK